RAAPLRGLADLSGAQAAPEARIGGVEHHATERGEKNGTGEPSSQPASSIEQRSRLRRTLLFAGVFALLALIFVPKPMDHGHGGGYRLIFDASNTGVAFFQLLINVVFAALT